MLAPVQAATGEERSSVVLYSQRISNNGVTARQQVMQFALASSELRAVFDAAHRYMAGESSILELNGRISSARTLASAAGVDSVVLSVLDELSRMVNRRWNEWGLESSPITDEAFRAWLREQLVGVGPAA
jgi:hypothetical protein